MEAIIETGGKQYQVTKGLKLDVELLDAAEGTEVKFDVLACYGDKIQIGQPLVKDAHVLAKVVKHKRGEKIIVSTYKRRKGYHKTQGHRQELTEIEIVDIKN
jgi:large subunit ribosomal protein L21